jgi:sugar lactone lactonase YvrE
MPDGSLLVVSMRDHRILRWTPADGARVHADVGEHCGGHLNDMVVDSTGRAYAGEFGFDLMAGGDPATANLIRVDPDGAVSVVAEEMLFPNGSVITPDGQTLIVGETAGARYTAFTIQADGSLSDRRIWAQLAPTPPITTLAETLAQLEVGPDGCGLDAEGHIWAADEIGARCIRVAPGGAIVDEIAAPGGLDVFACMLGGDDGRTLLMCAAPDFMEHNRAAAQEAVLLTTTVEVPRAGLP